MSRFLQVRKVAAFAFIVTALAAVISVWNGTQALLAIASTHPHWRWLITSAIVLVVLFAAILPLFYHALYRYEGILCLPPRFRLLSRVAALTLAIMIATEMPRWIASLGPYWAMLRMVDWRTGATSMLSAVQNPVTINQISTLLVMFVNVAYILLLISLSRRAGEGSSGEVPGSGLLSWVSKMMIIAWSLWLAYTLVGIVYIPYLYFQFRNNAYEFGRTPPGLAVIMAAPIRKFVSQACILVAPRIVHRTLQEIEQDRIYAAYGELATGRITPGQL